MGLSGADFIQRIRTDMMIPSPIHLLTFLIFLTTLYAYSPGPAYADYGVAGMLAMGSEGGPSISCDNPFAPLLDLSDSDTSVGSIGDGATGNYSTSVTNASISASTGAQNAYFSTNNYYTANANTNTSFRDDLRFTVPAGTYPQGVHVAAHVHAEGGVSGGEDARLTCNFSFGTDSVLVNAIAPAPPCPKTSC